MNDERWEAEEKVFHESIDNRQSLRKSLPLLSKVGESIINASGVALEGQKKLASKLPLWRRTRKPNQTP